MVQLQTVSLAKILQVLALLYYYYLTCFEEAEDFLNFIYLLKAYTIAL